MIYLRVTDFASYGTVGYTLEQNLKSFARLKFRKDPLRRYSNCTGLQITSVEISLNLLYKMRV